MKTISVKSVISIEDVPFSTTPATGKSKTIFAVYSFPLSVVSFKSNVNLDFKSSSFILTSFNNLFVVISLFVDISAVYSATLLFAYLKVIIQCLMILIMV